MQLRLNLGGSPAPGAALWELVSSDQRQGAIAMLAALIAQTVTDGGLVGDCGAPGPEALVGE